MTIRTKANTEERKVLNMLRDIKLKDIKDNKKDSGKPKKKLKISRADLNKMRDDTLKRLRSEMGVGAGRPKKAITIVRKPTK